MLEMHGGFSEMLASATAELSSVELDVFTHALLTVSDNVKKRAPRPKTVKGFARG
jgi:hypothetical protein